MIKTEKGAIIALKRNDFSKFGKAYDKKETGK